MLEFGKKLAYKTNREELNGSERFTDPAVRMNVESDLALLDH